MPQAAELRTKLRETDTRFRVVKNTLTERAADEAGAEASSRSTSRARPRSCSSRATPRRPPRRSSDFRRTSGLLAFKGGWMNGAALSADEIDAIAKLPSREVLYGRLVGMVASPLTGLAGAMGGLIGGLARQLQQMADQGLVGGDAPRPRPAAGRGGARRPTEAAPAAETEAAPAAEPDAGRRRGRDERPRRTRSRPTETQED